MPRALTNAQYNFVREVIAGKTLEAAYASAYPKSRKWSRSVRDSTASKLLKTPSVWEFYSAERQKVADTLNEEARSKAIWSRQKSIEALAFVVGVAVQDAKENKRRKDADPDNAEPVMTATIANSIIKGVCELNKMLDFDFSASQSQVEPIKIIDDYREDD